MTDEQESDTDESETTNTDSSNGLEVEVTDSFEEKTMEYTSGEHSSTEVKDSHIPEEELDDLQNPDGVIDIESNYSGSLTLVGTVHVSKKTRDRVVRTIEDVEPGVVGIELDEERLYSMFERAADDVTDESDVESGEGIQDMIREFVRNKQESAFDTDDTLRPGEADMLPAVDMAVEGDSDIALIDMSMDELRGEVKNNVYTDGKLDLELLNKPIDEVADSIDDVINSRTRMMNIQDGGISSIIDHFENAPLSEVHEQFEPLETIAPEFVEALIDERDRRMAGHLHWLRQEGYEVVSVMGRGHLPGVYGYLMNIDELPDEYVEEPDWYGYSTIDIDVLA